VGVDPSGSNLYFYEQAGLAIGGARIRRVDLGTGELTTYAGNGLQYGQLDGAGGDPADDVVEGAPALQSALGYTTSMVVEPATGDLEAVIYTVGLVRRVASNGDGTAGTIETVAGGGTNAPLNVPPLSAGLANPTGVSLDDNGTLYIAAGSHFGGGAEVYASDSQAINPVVGNGYAGYFPLENERALARLVERAASDRRFYALLKKQIARLRPQVAPRAEARAVLAAVSGLRSAAPGGATRRAR